MRAPSLLLLIVLLAAPLVAGCGGDDSDDADGGDGGGAETFEEEGFDLTFEYPADFEQLDDIEFARTAGSRADATAGVGIDETNLIAVQRFELRREITADNLSRVQREADALFSELAGEQVEGRETRAGGLPALEYRMPLEAPPDAETRAIAVFDGDIQYLINCQSQPEQRERMEQACDQALATLETR